MRTDEVHEGVSHVLNRDAGLPVHGLFEVEDAKHLVHIGLDSGVTHRFATAAENLRATQTNFQSGGELGSVNIAGPLPSHHQQTIFRHDQSSVSAGPYSGARGEPFA